MVLTLHGMPSYEIRILGAAPAERMLFADEIAEAGHLVAALAEIPTSDVDAAVDLVLVDEAMLESLDSEALGRIGAAWPHAALALLGHGSRPRDRRGLPCIPKDARTTELIKAVETAARGGQVEMGRDARTSRMDLLVRKIASRPAMAGVGGALPGVYEPNAEADLPSAMSKLLSRLAGAE
jgi:hypothetical protein